MTMATKIRRVPALPEDVTLSLREALRQLRDAQLNVKQLEEALERQKTEVRQMERERLPRMFSEAGINQMGLEADGNHPALSARLSPFYRANIAADWDEDRRTRAFAELERCGAGDLVRHTVTVDVPRGDAAVLSGITDRLRQLGVNFNIRPSVPWNTLSAWLREMVEVHKKLPQLDLIGGDVGQVVKIKETR